MISKELNDTITLTGPGSDAGAVLRRYWQPAALSDELAGERPLVPVTLLGERLVLFRDNNGALGLIDRHCPHRGADLCHGRLEDNGLRCPFHGWHFDRSGQCVEQPGEPDGSRMHESIRATSYPVEERNGIIFAYMGPGDPPPFPNFDCFRAPDTHVFAFKGLWECNWLQAMEVGIDPAHASFLHRFLKDEDPADSYGKQFRDKAADTNIPMTKLLRDYTNPEITVEETDYGLRLIALRHLDAAQSHIRITNQIFPQAISIPMSREMIITQWHVPIDDEHCYWYSMFTSFTDPVDKELMRAQRLKEHRLPDYAPLKNKRNNYGFNPEEQRTETYTGMGMDINVHDQWAVESPGPIFDRTREHLGKTDVAIIKYRRMLRAAIAAVKDGQEDALPMRGDVDPATVFGPISNDTIGDKAAWRAVSATSDAERRAGCTDWDATVSPS
ncbi:aromatic ring-hydroxylating dioxygenase subunit alpha [Sulfitobacter sp. M57]|uniref:aromatic ring-hydroxylating dioxygenase subunit alpha n=1 Tax=unclassified Sulfitobacter TaxID=196795 RepID=UPI0023E280EF|nr:MULTISPECIES: aromatic ring-hydroxylating dioxygenase subunit alpha [unclassified Sulfitobacter]MDF3415501.1 aromatic ring-hydroxylating dioxygenase subunit alpha [Sulfitobacter sp. KE5]MDF3422982.1 aromatic ring-hydroxylating dioxygenase subunit alpha [Sulfitobacter sp. KE43]MDF3434047.1 aromatic ring-hydroxylating dioxygenase subunit alpha [Sulfitobacter sp. KE42]MDF3459920.1 aromatic ring-hydroxylating dioxygenase subunit alpha [Sulfitobacter sp. S74]MDF3463586.1 aromatic ring-hydroxylat